MSKWVKYVEISPAVKTRRWCVQTAGGDHGLGIVKWIARWRCYGFEPFLNTVYEKDCLRDIAEFYEQQTKAHKAAAAQRSRVEVTT